MCILAIKSQGDKVRVISRRRASDFDLPELVAVFQGNVVDIATDLGSFVQGRMSFITRREIIDPGEMHDIHVVGTKRLIVAADQIHHWVQLRSVAVYGPVTAIVTDMSPAKSVGGYGETKAQVDRLVIEGAGGNRFSY